MNKTILEWFDLLDPQTKDLALLRYKQNGFSIHDKNLKYETLKRALQCAFVWKNTPEGFEFWQKKHDEISSDL